MGTSSKDRSSIPKQKGEVMEFPDFPWTLVPEVRFAAVTVQACAYNAAVNYGSGRADKKMRRLVEAINTHERAEGKAKLQFLVEKGVIDSFKPCPPECHFRPGGLFHARDCENDGNSEISRSRRRAAIEQLPEKWTYAASPSLVGE
jgi:hypothetical protein